MISIDVTQIEKVSNILSRVNEINYDKALNDAVQVILISTKRRYMEQVSPDGERWMPNSPDYAEMKGQESVLTGPISKKIKGGELAGKFEFANIPTKRMKNSLIHEVNSALKQATIFYDSESDERASLHQFGGEAKLVLVSTTTGRERNMLFTVPARPHLGISDDDADKIEEIFATQADVFFTSTF